MYRKIQKIEDNIPKAVSEMLVNAYVNPITNQKKRQIIKSAIFFGVFVGVGILAVVSAALYATYLQTSIFAFILLIDFAFYYYFIVYNPRLSSEGNDLWRAIQGFKLFLSITEKDRVKNLTPDMFEKYLPYAVILGVEKEWSKKFEGVVTQNPNWFHANTIAASTVINSTSTFSASAFSTSFATSFSSSFSSSSASSGGGSAGGGGGGGGGGAS